MDAPVPMAHLWKDTWCRELGMVRTLQMQNVVGHPTVAVVRPCEQSVRHFRELEADSPTCDSCDCTFIPGLGFAVQDRSRPYGLQWRTFHNDATGERWKSAYDIARIADLLSFVAPPCDRWVTLGEIDTCLLVLKSQDGNRLAVLARGADSVVSDAFDVHVVAVKATDFPVYGLDHGPVCSESRVHEAARAAHEANRMYCESIGDASQAPWDEAPEWQRVSAIKGVRAAILGATPRESHEGWLIEKRDTGWTYGPVKDAEAKTHPCMVEYDDLPPEQRVKDVIFLSVVRSVYEALGVRDP